MLELKQIEMKFSDTRVISDINLQIPMHGVTSIIGGNGAGKSTLLGIMSRLLVPTSGTVTLNNIALDDYEPSVLAKKMAILTQSQQVQARLSVRELVTFGRFPYHKGRPTEQDNRLIDDAIRFFDLQALQHRFLDQLSGGQKQRAFIAMVFAQDSDYVLLDEPLNNLDMKHSRIMMKLIRQAADESGKRVIVVLHDINFASIYSDQIIAMRDGAIIYHQQSQQFMTAEKLEKVFDMPMQVQVVDDKRVSFYYT
ncbi:iron ABC transporter ATP-binding protein [Vibrio sp. UCD-FRSSP16_10]|uniref:iron ABC transporter ATP-binding protein n=1 Tax=unclassified Vibrio TaxID=2614977 RepID=UPI0007FD6C52|nr:MULTISPECIES: ATP-binding cassette domain-containing protein [unclassified Vibrio]OBT13852.1 iron ABC transporter ATP-binding protein [Vibrio sp. UCD-FRSSP16_30]OBT22733.1 iron ABC transporter ATP-binding protein [Vibrio sp. UCD-FRSSP16_10]